MSVVTQPRPKQSVSPDQPTTKDSQRSLRTPGLAVWSAFSIALHGLGRNRIRTFLSTLGIIVGIGCVLTMMAIGEGTRSAMIEQIRRTGSAVLTIRPEQQRVGAVRLGMENGRESLTMEDAAAIAEACSAVVMASPQIDDPGTVEWRNQNTRTRVVGITRDYLPIRNFSVGLGRPFTEQESQGVSRICLIGPVVAEELFGDDNPIGKRIRIERQRFRVIGVMRDATPGSGMG
jgi:putative ABC transport system permease protein